MGESNENQQQGQDQQGAEFTVDEEWKQSVAREQGEGKDENASETPEQSAKQPSVAELPSPDFRVFLAGLYTQTLMSLGELENPVTKSTEKNLRESQYIIDTIDMLRHKTEGNLTDEEEHYIEGLLHDLRIRYVAAAKDGGAGEAGAADGR